MSFLLDTNVISETRKASRMDDGVRRWLCSVEADELYISALVLGEIRLGVERLRRRDRYQAEDLEAWLLRLRDNYEDKVLAVDGIAAEEWGRINVPDPVSTRDGLMAATALVKGMTFVTRNTTDVERTGVKLLNPFEGAELGD